MEKRGFPDGLLFHFFVFLVFLRFHSHCVVHALLPFDLVACGFFSFLFLIDVECF